MLSVTEILKGNKKVRSLYNKVEKKVLPIFIKISPVLASKFLYKLNMGEKLNLNNPVKFNEKLQWLKLYWQHPLVVKCADKYEVRKYVTDLGYKELLNELYGVYENVNEIEWSKLPESFVLKATHGCGFNIICPNKSELNKESVMKQLSEWLSIDYGLYAAEIQYSKINHRIIAEKYLGGKNGELPIDYKIYCFNGEPKLILLCNDREKDVRRNIVDLNWNSVNIYKENILSDNLSMKPKCLEKMLEYVLQLSRPFPFVRIDFYIYEGKPLLGEMTFTPGGCLSPNFTEEGEKMLGDMLTLPKKYMKKDYH